MKLLKVKAVPSDSGEWIIDVLGAPFGDPEDRDAHGEYFDPERTDFWLDKIPQRPILHYHGFGQATPEIIGQELKNWIDEEGVWFRVLLDQTKEAAGRIWEAAKQGLARASSGAISHLVRELPGGTFSQWPIGELSLMSLLDGEFPANPHARIELATAKARFRAAGISLGADVESQEAIGSAQSDLEYRAGLAFGVTVQE